MNIEKITYKIIKDTIINDEMNDFISRPGEPIQKFSGDDTIMGAKGLNFDVSPVVSAINTLKGEMTGLREEMKGYLASGGTLERGIGKGTVAAIDDAAV